MMKLLAALLLFVVVAHATKQVLQATSPTAIKDSYIVVLKEGSEVARRDAHIEKLQAQILAANDNTSMITFKYSIGSFIGFSAKLSAEMLQIELEDPDVDYVEADQVVTIFGTTVQKDSTWGISRISVNTTSWSTVKKPYNYTYDSSAGAGVTVYVIDTGILTTHTDFGGRASFGFSAISGEPNVDQNGHGTHCAGTIGGTTYGVAKKAKLVAVKVLAKDGSGTYSGVIAGINYVTKQKTSNKNLLAVASMSLGGGKDDSVNNAVTESIKAGVVYSIAAGNSYGANACNFSPAGTPTAITVGSTTNTDSMSSFSNVGPCVTIFAPGSSITSDWIGSNTATNTISGTSMACPHVSGVLALKLGVSPTSTPAQLKTWIVKKAIKGVITGLPANTNNTLLYSPAPITN